MTTITSNTQYSQNFIDYLPLELILNIFKFVDQEQLLVCAQVSQLWRIVTTNASLWKHLIFTCKTSNVIVLRFGSFIQSIKMQKNWVIDSYSFNLFSKYCINLTHLNIGRTTLEGSTDIDIGDFLVNLSKYGKLRFLNIAGYTSIKWNHLSAILNYSSDLNYLNLWGDFGLSKPLTEFENLIPSHKLTYLNTLAINGVITQLVCRSPYIQQLYVNGLDVNINLYQKLLLNCKNITHLFLGNCHLLTDEDLFLLFAFNNLKLFCIQSNLKITNKSIALLGRHISLVYLNLFECTNLTDEGLFDIATNCKELRFVDLVATAVREKTIILMAQNLKKLRYLDHYASITQESIRGVLHELCQWTLIKDKIFSLFNGYEPNWDEGFID